MKKTYLLSLLFVCSLVWCNAVQAQTCGDIYVRPNGTGNGTMGSPTNINVAIEMLREDTSRHTIYMLEGIHGAFGTIKLPSHSKIYGGYRAVAGNWVKGDSTNVTRLDVFPDETIRLVPNSDGDTVLAKGLIGIQCDTVNDILISDINLVVFNMWHSYDGEGNGISMYGVYAKRSFDINLVRVKITTEAAGDGRPGDYGVSGRDAWGMKGGGQILDNILTIISGNPKYKTDLSTSNNFRAGGKGGSAGRVQDFVKCTGSPVCVATPCVPELPKPAGESGGRSGVDPAFPNLVVPGGPGGPCGDACKFDCYYDTYQQFISKPAIVSNIFNNGTIIPSQLDPNPTLGADGVNGTGVRNGGNYTNQAQAAIGEKRELYIPSKGFDGGDGAGGGGGGGGGAGAIRVFALPPVGIEFKVTVAKIALENLLQLAGVDVCSAEVLNIPGKGGNGGGGGEGGQGGGGGGGGGGNFGVYGVQNSIVATHDCVFELGAPGLGGDGGLGGNGGLGASGMAAQYVPYSMENWNNVGAAGGRGGNGGKGGDGMKGRVGETYSTYGLNTSNNQPTLMISHKKGCTSSLTEVVIGSNDYITPSWTGTPGEAGLLPGPTPNSYYINAGSLGTLTLRSTSQSPPYNSIQKSIVISEVRDLPVITATQSPLCVNDTFKFTTGAAQQYLWKIYNAADSLVKTYTTQSGVFDIPVMNVNYKITLNVYDDCCGWSAASEYTFTKFKSSVKPELFIVNPQPYCQGFGSTDIQLTGQTNPAWDRVWSNGSTDDWYIEVDQPGGYWLKFRFENGCYSLNSDTIHPNIMLAPTNTVPPMTFDEICDKYPPLIIPFPVPYRNFSYFEGPNDLQPMPGGGNVYDFRPDFKFQFGQNSKTIYYAVIDPNTGCPGFNRSPITLNAETTPPHVYTPNYYKFYPSTPNCEAYVQYPEIGTFDWCSESGAILDSGMGNYKYYPIGRHYNKYKIADQRGNFQYFYLTIDVVDESGPYITNCPYNEVLNSDSGRCGAVYHYPTLNVTENCGLSSSRTWVATSAPGSYVMDGDSVFPVGINTVNRSYTDANNNTSICTYTVEVRDFIRPTITCPPDTTYYLPSGTCSMLVQHEMPLYSDNCSGATLELAMGLPNYTVRPRGEVYQTYKVYSRGYADSAQCFFKVSVKDITPPVFTSVHPTLILTTDTGRAYATLPMYSIPTASDSCGSVIVSLIDGLAPGDTAGLGNHTIKYEAKDASGNTAYYEIDVVVSDFEGPSLNCPGDITVQANNGLCGSVVHFTTPVALDNDGSYYPVTLNNGGIATGGVFPLGTTKNYYYARDAANNLSGCIMKITVVDTVAPVMDCPNDTVAYLGGNLCNVYLNIGTPIIVDEACPNSVQGFSAEGATLSLYYGTAVLPAGQHTLTYKAADGSGNVSACYTHINVLDTVNYTLTCEPGYTVNTDPGQCGATVIYTQPKLTPFVSESGCVTVTVQGTGNGSFRPVGTSTDVYTYQTRNSTLTCATTITVVDNQPTKMKNCGRDTTVYAENGQCSAYVSFIEPSIEDNCLSTASLLQWRGGPSGSSFAIGTTRNVYYIYDNMTMIDSCVFAITVADTVRPVVLPPADVIVQTDQICGTVVNFAEPEGTDNSNCAFTTRVDGKAPGSVFPVGTTKQTYRVSDNYGNIDTCSFNVIVQPDTAMHVDCLSPPSTHAPNGLGEVVYYQTPGNFCEGTRTVFKSGLSSGAFYPVGLNKDEYLIIDRVGDTATCTITVHVFETQPPILTCGANVNITVHPDSLVNCMAYVNVPPTIATDLSGVNLFYNEYNSDTTASDYYPIGNTTVVWKASSQGMDAQCVQFVRVNAALTTTYDTIAHRQKRCSGQTIVYDPRLTIGDSVEVIWQKLAFGSLQTISTEKVLVLENPDYFSTGGIYYLYLKSPCVQTPQLVGLFELTVYDSPEVNIGGLASQYCFDDTARKQVITSPEGGVLFGKGIVDGYFYPSLADTGLHTLMYVRDTSDYDGNPNNPNNLWKCSDTARLVVRVNAYPEPTPFIAASYCVNGSAVLLDTSGSSYVGAGISGYNFNPQIAGGGTHTITRTLSKGGCSISYGKQVSVSTDIPDATILSTGPYCDNIAPQLLLAADTGGIWTSDSNAIDVDVLGRAVFTPRYANVGAVPVKYTITRGVCEASDSIAVQVKSSHYNVPYNLPEYCLNSPPIELDSVGKRYVGPGFENNVLHPDSFADGGIKFYMVVGLNAVGCEDTVFRMYWLHGPDVPFDKDIAACTGDSVQVDLQGGFVSSTWLDNGSNDTARWLAAPGIYALALEDTFGCVGTDTVTFAYYAKPSTGITAYGDSLQADAIVPHYQWYMNSTALPADTLRYLNVSGNAIYYVALTDSSGCITYSDTINRMVVCTTKYASRWDTICSGEQLNIGTHIYTQTGTYTDTLTTAIGCDSILTTFLEVLPTPTSSLNHSMCNGASYSFGGIVRTITGTYIDTLTSTNGCDSIVTLNLTVLPIVTNTINATICNNTSYAFNGQQLNASGTYTDTLTAANGCDSVVTLNLSVLLTASQTISANICAGDVYSFNGQSLTAAGTYKDTLTAANGCDSILMLNLTVKQVAASSISQSICAGTSFSFGGDLLAAAGTYRDTLVAVNGCDSIVTLQLALLPVYNVTVNKTICNGSSYNFNGILLNTAGTYYDTLTTVNGCDSAIVLHLSLSAMLRDTINAAICNGNSYNFNGTILNVAGTYADTLSAGSGCDSAIVLHLVVNQLTTGTHVVTACGSYTWIDGNTYTASNNTATHTITGGSINGCDSIVTLNLTINNPAIGTDVQAACGSYTWIDGNTYTASNNTATHTIVGGSVNGCDSVVTLSLTISNATTGIQTVAACGSYTWIDGNTYTASNNTAIHTIVGGSTNGCDSVVTLNLTINNATTGIQTVAACSSYTWIDGNTYTASNNTATHTIVGGSVNGCDSVVALNLTIGQAVTTTLSESICAGAAYSFNGDVLTAAGIYSDTLTGANNCDSIIVLTLSVDALPIPTLAQNNDTLYTQTFTSYQWLLNGGPVAGADSILVATANGNYAVIVVDANGCSDTSAVLTVTGVSISQIDGAYGVSIFPNPNKGSFTVLFKDMDEHTLYVTDALGRLIVDQTRVKHQHAISISEQAAGIYYLHILYAERWQSYKISVVK